MNEVQRINESGLANGWHAQMLQKTAESKGVTMAQAYNNSLPNRVAGSSVPALCTKVTSTFVFYEFLDGSKTSYINMKKDNK